MGRRFDQGCPIPNPFVRDEPFGDMRLFPETGRDPTAGFLEAIHEPKPPRRIKKKAARNPRRRS
jgi:hypothetical protein